MTIDLSIAYHSATDYSSWERGFLAGDRPDEMPYGLQAIAIPNHKTRLSPFGLPPQRKRDLARTVLRSTRLGNNASSGNTEILFAWDEVSHFQAVNERRWSGSSVSGLIWATDEPKSLRARSQRHLAARYLPSAAAIWVLSQAQVEPAREWLGRNCPPISFIPFGINPSYFAPHVMPIRHRVLSIGNDRDRDLATLFGAIEIIRRARPETEFLIQSPQNVKPPAGVRLLPRLTFSQLRDAYASSTLLLTATKHNLHVSGMTAALEAAATGRPVVMTHSPGLDDYVRHEETGLVTPPGDPARLAEAAIAVLEDAELADRLGNAGRRNIEDNHSVASMTSAFANMLGTIT